MLFDFEEIKNKVNTTKWYGTEAWYDILNAIADCEDKSRPQGKWIDKGWKGDWQFETDGRGNCWHEYECSECGFHNKGSKSNYCPNCYAKMKGADDYERAIEQVEHDALYEPTYNSEDGSM